MSEQETQKPIAVITPEESEPLTMVKQETPKQETPELETSPKVLSANDIFGMEDIETVGVVVPEWGGGIVRLRALSGEEAVKFAEAAKANADQNASAVTIVALCAVDETGKSLFTIDQIELLKKKSLRAIMRLQKVAMRINGLSKEGVADTKEV